MISALMADPNAVAKMEKIVALCKRRGFIFQSSEIYGGLNGAWDYGPLGVELKRNLKDYWWKCMTQVRDDIVGFDGSILMNRAVWKASGHEATFSDPMVDCKTCKARFRADQLEALLQSFDLAFRLLMMRLERLLQRRVGALLALLRQDLQNSVFTIQHSAQLVQE